MPRAAPNHRRAALSLMNAYGRCLPDRRQVMARRGGVADRQRRGVLVIVRLDHRAVEGQAAIGARGRGPYDDVAAMQGGVAFRAARERSDGDAGIAADLEVTAFDALQ